MTRVSQLVLRIVVLASLAAATAAVAEPFSMFRQPPRPQKPPRVETPGYTFSGTYGGMIGEQVLVDGTTYVLRAKTEPYLLGTGLIKWQEVPIGARVVVSVFSGSQGTLVWGVVVRPANEALTKPGDALPAARVRSQTAPR